MLGATKYRRDIQVLRGLAVVAVVLFHANEDFFPQGYLGVDVFFIISGFLVTPLILRIFTDQAGEGGRLSNLVSFYQRRFYRLAPAMLLMLSSSAILVLLLISPTSFNIFGKQSIDTVFFLGNYGAFKNVGDYFNSSGNPLVHTWSLSVEEQIYFFLPVLMLLVFLKRQYSEKVSIIVLVLITSLSLFLFISPTILLPVYDIIGISDSNFVYFYSPLHRIWQFTLGGVGYMITKNGVLGKQEKNWVNQVILFCLFVMLFGPFSFGSRASSFLVSFISLAVICSFSLSGVKNKGVMPLEWLGDRSYSIYLFHMPLIFIAKSSPYLSTSSFSGLFIAIAILLSIYFGSISYSRVENRYRISHLLQETLPARFKMISSLLAFSLLLSTFMIKGSNNEFWGLQKTIRQPPVAWSLDKNCTRMSFLGDPPCVYELVDATKTVLLIGDSRAAQFSQALVDASKKAGWNSVVWTMAGCNFVLSEKTGKIPQDCLKRNLSILSWLNEFRPNVVILSQYNKSELPQVEMKSAVLKLKRLVPRVLVIGNTPTFPDRKFMVSPALFQDVYDAPKKVSTQKMDSSNQMISNVFLKGLAIKGVEIVELNELWCTLEYCIRFGKRGWLFSDTEHLSMFGAEMSVPYFTKFLNEH